MSVSDPRVAVRVVLPAATVVARPELLTVATDVDNELQVTPLTRSCVDKSLYVAVTVYCWLMPMPSVSPSGVIEIEVMVGLVTVRVVLCVTLPSVAVMVVEPAATLVTSPVASMVALEGADELQLTKAVRSRLLPSL